MLLLLFYLSSSLVFLIFIIIIISFIILSLIFSSVGYCKDFGKWKNTWDKWISDRNLPYGKSNFLESIKAVIHELLFVWRFESRIQKVHMHGSKLLGVISPFKICNLLSR